MELALAQGVYLFLGYSKKDEELLKKVTGQVKNRGNSYDQIKMTEHVHGKMINLYFKDDRPLATIPLITS